MKGYFKTRCARHNSHAVYVKAEKKQDTWNIKVVFKRCPPYSSVHRRLKLWAEEDKDKIEQVFTKYAEKHAYFNLPQVGKIAPKILKETKGTKLEYGGYVWKA